MGTSGEGALLILGAGPAGLAAGTFARQHGMDFALLETTDTIGGLTRTFEHDGFAFDSGAHRLHDKDPWATATVAELLGDDLRQVERPSLIHDQGHLLPFPLSAASVLRHLGIGRSFLAGVDLLQARLRPRPRLRGQSQSRSFEDFALRAYGRTIADRFLLGYSQKLWGVPCSQLTPEIAGKRLRGMDLRQVVAGMLMRGHGQVRHVEGRFFYPRGGIGAITKAMADACGEENIRTRCPVTGLRHDGRRITSIESAGHEPVAADQVISTISLDHLIDSLDPAIPELSDHARHLRYRAVVLVAVMLRRCALMSAATVYFPSPEIPFNRVCEPIQRCPEMAPDGCTSLVAEIACDEGDRYWAMPDHDLLDLVRGRLCQIGWIKPADCIGGAVRRLKRAYPVLTMEATARARSAIQLLEQFENLRIVGRNARFEYSWIHNQLRNAHDAVAELASRAVLQP